MKVTLMSFHSTKWIPQPVLLVETEVMDYIICWNWCSISLHYSEKTWDAIWYIKTGLRNISMAIFKTWIRQMRTRIRRTRRTWRTRRIRRIWRIRRIAYAIFKRFLSFIYSPTKGFIISSKLCSELYLAQGWTTSK